MIGRDAELAALASALAEQRLVTVTGAAGVGKSRLVLAAVVPTGRGPWEAMVRVRWHDAIPLGQSTLAARIARALGAAFDGPRSLPSQDLATAMRSLTGGEFLLFLDDVDAVHAECSWLVRSLLKAWPTLRIVVTARRPLGLGAEHVVRLAPLATETEPGSSAPAPATRLFLAAARERGLGSRHDPGVVAWICRLLEGNALAIELAAAQLTSLTLGELADKLLEGQCWLASPGAMPTRHRSPRATLGIVHTLCEPVTRAVWRRTSVFAGTFTGEAASFVGAGDDLDPDSLSAALAELTAIGVLERQEAHDGLGAPRYRMTRAARDFGAERLASAGETAVAQERHARHCRSVAAAAEMLWNAGLQRQAAQLVRDEHDDLAGLFNRAARLDPAQAETALEAVLHLWFWWAAHNHARDGVTHLLALLPRLPAHSALAAPGRWLAGWLLVATDPPAAGRLLNLAWPAAVLDGNTALIGRVAHAFGTLAWQLDDLSAAADHYRLAADTIPVKASGGPTPTVSLAALAVVQARTNPADAVLTADQALAQQGGRHDTWATTLAHYARALADHRTGDSGRARYRALRALNRLDSEADAPQARDALCRLLDRIGTPSSRAPASATHHVRLPGPRTGSRPVAEGTRQAEMHTLPRRPDPPG